MRPTAAGSDPYLRPTHTVAERGARALWLVVSALLFRPSPRPLHRWRAALLRLFGARLGSHCHVYPKARIWAPWNLVCDDAACIADDAIVYNVAPVWLGSHAVVSQEAYLCTGTHDIDDARFPLRARPIAVGAYAWVCARATVGPGVTVGDGAVLGMQALATRDLAPWTVHIGVPARPTRARRRHDLA